MATTIKSTFYFRITLRHRFHRCELLKLVLEANSGIAAIKRLRKVYPVDIYEVAEVELLPAGFIIEGGFIFPID